jgi:hypothetical protein
VREQRVGDAEDAVPAQLQQHRGQQHAHWRGGLDVGVGQPGVERDGRQLHQEADHQQAEQHLGHRARPAAHGGGQLGLGGGAGQLDQVERPAVEVDADQRDQQGDGADQRVEEELDGRVLTARAAPDADQEVHRQQADLEEGVELEQVQRHEHADQQRLQQQHQRQVPPTHARVGPPGQHGQRGDEGGQQQHRQRQPVDADAVVDVERGDPEVILHQLHGAAVRVGGADVGVEADQQRQGQDQRRERHAQGGPPGGGGVADQQQGQGADGREQ